MAKELRFCYTTATEVKCTFYVRKSFFTLADTQFAVLCAYVEDTYIDYICLHHYMENLYSLSINISKVGGSKAAPEGKGLVWTYLTGCFKIFLLSNHYSRQCCHFCMFFYIIISRLIFLENCDYLTSLNSKLNTLHSVFWKRFLFISVTDK